jgi:predicted glycoside hydrolase/deacetylase ChbG (UPF0249 family)
VRSASLLVTFPRAAEAAELARVERGLEVGLHLDLVEGRPVSDPSDVPTLVGGDGRFLGLTRLFAGVGAGRVRAAEIGAEVRAQVARARALGTPALAWDSHRHAHLFPLIARVVGAVARDEGARWIRRAWPASRSWKSAALGAATAASAVFFREVPGNDRLVDLTFERPRPDAAWVGLLATLDGVTEVVTHPGPPAGDPADTIAAPRARDLALLTDPILRAGFGDDTVRWRVPPGVVR